MPGKYRAYPEYKDSEVEWLGAIPSHWARLPLKYMTGNKVKDGPHETPKFIDDGVPFLSVDGIQNNELVFDGCRYVSEEDHQRFSLKCRPAEGDVLLGKAASVGKVAYVDTSSEFNVWSPLAVITPKVKTSGRFIFYSIQSAALQAQCDLRSNSNTQKNLGMGDIDNLFFAAPNISEQASIVDFLNHETAKIDTLIYKQQQLIKLLKEKRQAVISHAVTKGVNPDAPMKDSKHEWLGVVPEHWSIVYSKWLFTERNTKAMDNDEMLTASQKYGVISQKEFMRLENQKVVQVQIGHDILKHVETNDFVISMRSFQGGIEFCPVRGAVSSAYVPLVPTGIICSSYFKHLFKSTQYVQALQSTTNLVRDGQALRYNNFIQVRLPLPPLDEQKEIAEYLDASVKKIDALIEKADQGTELLNERRTALISAAVTGKIDVRNWQPSQTKIPMEANA